MTSNYPAVVLDYAGTLARHYGVRRDAVLLAAARATVEHPPTHPVAYPTMSKAARRVAVAYPKVFDVVARRYFYARVPWAVWYGLVHHTERIGVLLRFDADTLALFDASQYNRHTATGGQSCGMETMRAPLSLKR